VTPQDATPQQRIDAALAVARTYGGIQGDAHRAWVIHQMLDALTGGRPWPVGPMQAP